MSIDLIPLLFLIAVVASHFILYANCGSWRRLIELGIPDSCPFVFIRG